MFNAVAEHSVARWLKYACRETRMHRPLLNVNWLLIITALVLALLVPALAPLSTGSAAAEGVTVAAIPRPAIPVTTSWPGDGSQATAMVLVGSALMACGFAVRRTL
jgi:hypothetical protein